MNGIYNAVTFDDSVPPVWLTPDPGLDLRILAATMDLRFQGRAIFTTYLTHARDPYALPVTHIFVFDYHLYGDSIGTDSGGVWGRRLQSSIRFTMKYVVPDSAGTGTDVASHTYLFTR